MFKSSCQSLISKSAHNKREWFYNVLSGLWNIVENSVHFQQLLKQLIQPKSMAKCPTKGNTNPHNGNRLQQPLYMYHMKERKLN